MRLVTMADDAYAPGLAALVQSLVERAELDDVSLTVIEPSPLRRDVKAALERSGLPIEYADLAALGSVIPKDHTRGIRRTTLQKLLVFALPADSPIAFIDSDMLCLSPLRGIDELVPFSAALDTSLKALPEVAGRPVFNSGFFVFEPDAELAAEVIDFYVSSDTRFLLGDQMVLNEFLYTRHPEVVHHVDPCWNTIRRTAAVATPFSLEGVRLLHYTGRKPWDRSLLPDGRGAASLLHMDHMWWDHYLRSPVAEVLDLRPPPRWVVRALHSRPVERALGAVREARRARLSADARPTAT